MLEKQLKSKLKGELVSICKDMGLSSSGTKAVLIDRILSKSPNNSSRSTVAATPRVLDTFSNRNTILVVKNSYGNYEHQDSGLVFEKDTGKVIGRQVGEFVEKLTRDSINYCDIYGLTYDTVMSTDDDTGRIDIDMEMIQLVKDVDGAKSESDDEEEGADGDI
jgi:hypothetical protein